MGLIRSLRPPSITTPPFLPPEEEEDGTQMPGFSMPPAMPTVPPPPPMASASPVPPPPPAFESRPQRPPALDVQLPELPDAPRSKGVLRTVLGTASKFFMPHEIGDRIIYGEDQMRQQQDYARRMGHADAAAKIAENQAQAQQALAGAEANKAHAALFNNQATRTQYEEVSPGATLFDPKAGKAIYTAPNKPVETRKITPEMADKLKDFGIQSGMDVPANDFDAYMRIIDARERRGSELTMSPEVFRRTMQLNAQFKSDPTVKVMGDIESGLRSMKDAANQNNGVGDVTLMRLFAKLTDPTTGVREEEYNTMQGAQGALQSFKTWFQGRWTDGNRLTPEARRAFMQMVERVYANRRASYVQTINRYRSLAQRSGVDPQDVLQDIGEAVTAPPPGADAPPPQPQSASPTPSTEGNAPQVKVFRNPKNPKDVRHSLDGGKTWYEGEPPANPNPAAPAKADTAQPGPSAAPTGKPDVAAIRQKITDVAKREGVDPALALVVVQKESNFNPRATGSKGDGGLFQLMPGTAKQLGVTDVYNADQNIEGGIKHLSYLLKKYNGDRAKALMAYNGGEGNVDRGTVSDAAKMYAATALSQLGQGD